MLNFAAVFDKSKSEHSWQRLQNRLFSSVGQSTWFVISGSLVRIRQEALTREEVKLFGWLPEWTNGADCKSAGARLRWFESITTHFTQWLCGNSSVDRALAFQAGGRGFEPRFPLSCCYSSVVEHFLGKEEVTSSNLVNSSGTKGKQFCINEFKFY